MPMTQHGSTRVKVFAVRLFFKGVLRLLLPLALSSSWTALWAQTIEIKLVNGQNGRAMAGSCVNVGVGNERKKTIAIPTDKDGIARLRLTDNDAEVNTSNLWKNCGLFGVIDPVVKYDDLLPINVGYVLCQLRKPDYSWLAMTDFPTKQVVLTCSPKSAQS